MSKFGRGCLWSIAWSLCIGCALCGDRRSVGPHTIAARQHAQRGLGALHDGRITEAEQHFSQAITLDPRNAELHRYYAESLWRRDSRGAAIEELEMAVKLSGSTDAPQLIRLGQMYLAEQRWDEALAQAQSAIGLATESAEAWILRGDVLRQQGEWSEALGSYHRALVYEPGRVAVQMEIARIHEETRAPRRALAMLDRITDAVDTPQSVAEWWHMRGRVLQRLGQHEEAASALAEACRHATPSAELWLQLAEAHLDCGRPDRAHWAARQALHNARDPRPVYALLERIQPVNRHARSGDRALR